MLPNQQANYASGILHYEHDANDIYTTKIDPHLETNIRDIPPLKDEVENGDDDQQNAMEDEEEEDYSYLILDQFNKGKKNEGKNIIQDENYDTNINQ